MRTLVALEDLRSRARRARREDRRVGFVPTMGALHQGHLSLVRQARARADLVVMSIFVNPLQFGPTEDYARYPRDPDRDAVLAASAGVDLLWMPTVETMYPGTPQVTVHPGPAGERLEGAARPGHFAGVLTVVLKLFAAAEPDVAVVGRKDFQQAALIRRMVRDLDLPVEIVVAPTVRESDGLALSSRNAYLGPEDRRAAAALSRALARGVDAFRAGERRAATIVQVAREVLEAEPRVVPDYVTCVGPDLEPSEAAGEESVLLLAARVGAAGPGAPGAGGTRLIDNVPLASGLEGDVRVAG